jgi:apolipoprotein D and lipocalin family protein
MQSYTRQEILADINVLDMNPTQQQIDVISQKYNINSSSPSDLKARLMQYTSYTDDTEIPREVKSISPIRQIFQENFNVNRYQGLWYNAASIPQPFDQGTAWETAEYKVIDEKTIQVTNTAYESDNSVRGRIVGKAEILDLSRPSQLYVTFPTGQPRMTNPVANYLVHITDYESYAVVGSFDGSNLYFLVRNRPIPLNLYLDLVNYAKQLGYNTSLLRKLYGAIDERVNGCILL